MRPTPAQIAANAARNNLVRDPDDGSLHEAGVLHYGGHLAEVPEPRVRLFSVPGVRRRIVTITVTKFILGSHYYVSIKEEDDLYWDAREGDEGGWRKPWNADELRGRVFEASYVRPHFIEGFVDRTLAEHFPDPNEDKYEIERETLGATTYGREGD